MCLCVFVFKTSATGAITVCASDFNAIQSAVSTVKIMRASANVTFDIFITSFHNTTPFKVDNQSIDSNKNFIPYFVKNRLGGFKKSKIKSNRLKGVRLLFGE